MKFPLTFVGVIFFIVQNVQAVITDDWIEYYGLNCYRGRGADNIEPYPYSNSISLDECKTACRNAFVCEGVIMKTEEQQNKGNCYLEMHINIEDCERGTPYTLHKKSKAAARLKAMAMMMNEFTEIEVQGITDIIKRIETLEKTVYTIRDKIGGIDQPAPPGIRPPGQPQPPSGQLIPASQGQPTSGQPQPALGQREAPPGQTPPDQPAPPGIRPPGQPQPPSGQLIPAPQGQPTSGQPQSPLGQPEPPPGQTPPAVTGPTWIPHILPQPESTLPPLPVLPSRPTWTPQSTLQPKPTLPPPTNAPRPILPPTTWVPRPTLPPATWVPQPTLPPATWAPRPTLPPIQPAGPTLSPTQSPGPVLPPKWAPQRILPPT